MDLRDAVRALCGATCLAFFLDYPDEAATVARIARAAGVVVWGAPVLRDRVREAAVITSIGGLRAARTAFVQHGLPSPPFIVRSNVNYHEPFYFVQDARDLSCTLPGTLAVIEYIEAVGLDGLRRKFRCFCFGDHALPKHVQTSQERIVRDATRVLKVTPEEEEYLALDRDPFEPLFVKARRALGLDVCDFDYSLVGGVPVVWEVNHPPVLNNLIRPQERPALGRIYAALEEELLLLTPGAAAC